MRQTRWKTCQRMAAAMKEGGAYQVAYQSALTLELMSGYSSRYDLQLYTFIRSEGSVLGPFYDAVLKLI